MGSKSDFVLDDDLDDDEEILQIHSMQLSEAVNKISTSNDGGIYAPDTSKPQSETSASNNKQPNESQEDMRTVGVETETTSASSPLKVRKMKAAQPTAVIIDGLPLSARRADLDAFMGASANAITNVRLRRLEQHGLLRVRVQFENEESTAAALEKDGTKFTDKFISVKPASYERWDAAASPDIGPRLRQRGSESRDPRQIGGASSQGAKNAALPDFSAVSNSFWSAFGAAKVAAEKLEVRAREIGQKIEHQLHVSEKVDAGKARMQQIDKDLNVSGKVQEFAQASRETAQAVDEKLHISDGVHQVMEGVGGAARIVAREVDESFRVSDKARDVTNAALSSPTVGGVARKMLSRIDGTTPPPKRKHYPQRLDLNDNDVNSGVDESATDVIDSIGDSYGDRGASDVRSTGEGEKEAEQ